MNSQNNESTNEAERPLVDLELSEAQAESAKGGDAGAGRVHISDFPIMKKADKST